MQKEKSIKLKLVTALMIAVAVVANACSPRHFTVESTSINSELGAIVCPQRFEVTMDFFSQLVRRQEQQGTPISETILNESMATDDAFDGLANSYLKTELYKVYQEFYQDLKYLSVKEENPNLQELIFMIKVEDGETSTRKEMIEKYKNKVAEMSATMKQMGNQCPDDRNKNEEPVSDPNKPLPNGDEPGVSVSPRQRVTTELVEAMRKVLAVTYQSCTVLTRKPLMTADHDLKGIRTECCTGGARRARIRTIDKLDLVQNTHHYLQRSYGQQCVDINKSPLIYDFGGRPSYTYGSKGVLNFFKNNGGSKELGYDCSAMVYTVLLGGGFRYKKDKMFSASDVEAAHSKQFMKPESKGWNCLHSVTFTGETSDPLLAGDIASMDGHTLMVYRAGKDPFGIQSVADCKSLNSSHFDFDFMQSSPSKEGVGVNIFVGKDYLETNGVMRKGMIEYAKNYCERVKNGSTKKINIDYFSIVRMSTSSSCRMREVSFQNESCVQGCVRTSIN